MGTARKRRASSEAASDSDAESVNSASVKKKTRRQSMEEERARARSWAEEQKRKKGATAGTPGPMPPIQEHVSGPTGTPVSVSSVRAASSVSRKLKAAAVAKISPVSVPAAPEPVINFGSSMSPKEIKRLNIAAEKERARLWAEEQRAKKAKEQLGVLTPPATSPKEIRSPLTTTATMNTRAFTSAMNDPGRAHTVQSTQSNSSNRFQVTSNKVEEDIELPKVPVMVEPTAEFKIAPFIVEAVEEVKVVTMPVPKDEDQFKEEIYFTQKEEKVRNANSKIDGKQSLEADCIKSKQGIVYSLSKPIFNLACFIARSLLCISGFLVLFYCLSVVYHDVGVTVVKVWNDQTFQSSQTSLKPKLKATICYINDAVTQAKVDLDGIISNGCVGNKHSTMVCPEHGVCYDGVFQFCSPSHLFKKVVGARRNKFMPKSKPRCEMTPLGHALVREMESIVEQWTVDCFCPGGSCKTHGNETFLLADLINQLEDTWKTMPPQSDESHPTLSEVPSFPDDAMLLLAQMSKVDVFNSNTAEGNRLVALTPKHRSQMNIPWGCLFSKWASFIVSFLVYVIFTVATISASQICDYPLITLAVSLVSFGSWKIYSIRRRREQIRKLVAEGQSVAYEKLIYEAENGANDGYAVPILRQDVASTLFPMLKKEQLNFSKDTWPRIVREMKTDSRIQIIQKSKGGAPTDCWIWLGNSASNETAHRRTPIRI